MFEYIKRINSNVLTGRFRYNFLNCGYRPRPTSDKDCLHTSEKILGLSACLSDFMKAFKTVIRSCIALWLAIAGLQGQVNVTTWGGDLSHDGLNSHETVLTPLNVGASGSFGLLFTHALDGQCYSQPLIVCGVSIGGTTHNVVYLTTQHDGVYAFDADNVTGANANPLWYRSLLPTGTTSVPSGDSGAGDITPEIGITATPVIDTTTNTLYTVSKVKTTSNSTYQQYLHALDITTGAEKFGGPVLVSATFHGAGTYGESTNNVFSFNSLREHGRAALVLYNGIVYVTYASHGDSGAYHGIILGFNASTLALVKQFIDTPNGFGAGIWMDGAGPAIDGSGNMYVATGNGAFDQSTNPNTTDTDWGESFLKLPTTGTFDVSFSNPLNWFTPNIYNMLNNYDEDLGSSGVLLLPDQTGGSHTHLLLGAGKGGTLYVVDRDYMGGLNTTADNAVQELAIGALFNTPAYFNGNIYYDPQYDHLYQRAVRYNPIDGSYIASSGNVSMASNNVVGMGVAISANGTSNGLVWFPSGGLPSTLYAYNASNVSGSPLYTFTTTVPGGSPINCTIPVFTVPTVANGKVYVTAYDSSNIGHLFVLGLLSTAGSAPSAPTNLTATATSGSRVTLNWTDNSTNEAGFAIMRATASTGPFTQVGSTGANVATYNDSGLTPSTTYYYEVLASNNAGNSALTNIASVPTLAPVSAPGLVAYWNLDEGNGSVAADVTANGHNGALNGEVTWISGYIGAAAIDFHGAGNAVANVTVPNSSSMQFSATQSFTLDAWILPGGLKSTDEAVIAKSRETGNYYGIWINSSNKWAFRGPGGDVVGSVASTTAWTNVAIVQDGSAGTRTLYVNGVSVGTGAAQAADGSGNLWMGQANGVTNPFPGNIDEVRLYNRALSVGEITTLVNSGQIIYYQDGFTRTGELQGSAPDVHNTNSHTWTVNSGTGIFATNGSAAYPVHASYSSAYLPVNGTSGIVLDGTVNFTLSAAINPDSSGYRLGICLNTDANTIVDKVALGGTGLSEVIANGGLSNYIGDSALVSGTPATASIAYSALNGTIIFSADNTILYTLTGVTAGQIAALRDVAIYDGASTSTTVDNFTLTVASTPPKITSANNATFAVGQLSSFTVTAAGTPTPTFSAIGLPTWASLNSTTGVLSGTPPTTSTSPYTISLTATNGGSPDATQSFTLNVIQTFNQWLTQYSLTGGATGTPKNDGISNLQKYLFDINPTTTMSAADRAALPVAALPSLIIAPATTPSTYLALTYRQNAKKTGVTINVQTSPDLQSWQTVTPDRIQSVGTDPTTGDPLIQVLVKATTPTPAKEFIRLNVTSP